MERPLSRFIDHFEKKKAWYLVISPSKHHELSLARGAELLV